MGTGPQPGEGALRLKLDMAHVGHDEMARPESQMTLSLWHSWCLPYVLVLLEREKPEDSERKGSMRKGSPLVVLILSLSVLSKPQRVRSTWGLETRAGSTRQRVGRAS